MLTLISTMGRTSSLFQLLLILFSCVPVQSEGCNVGWFGCKCQYQCHCKNNMACDVNGECVTGCDIDWFGTACQYANLATLPEVNVTIAPRQTTTWLTDGDDTTCNEDGNITSIHISWSTSYPFTWLRMKVKNTSLKFKNVNLTFLTSQKETPTCINKQVSFIDSTRIDYRCEMTETIIQLRLTGPALKSLCSLYISGGRNVALHQSADQTSTYNEGNIYFTASLAVDGNTTCNINDNSISHTLLEPKPSWSLRLDTPKVVNRFVIYNRVDCCMNRLKNFILTTFDINNKTLLTYQDLSPEAADIYTFPVRPHYPVSRIGIIPTDRDQKWDGDKFIVTICEIFMFGECMPGVWDLDCRHKCPEECPSWCQQDTGKCLSCLGHSDPPRCNTVCASGTYGINCQQNCSDNCYNNSCNSVTGECDKGRNGYKCQFSSRAADINLRD
ncbi:uncharacterized protein LOC129926172 [Biomphalaria glabrata]|uniref:Uncharacterized protein LOC129926172 n=1 Tax=Biomphalaria glabrata TaxID=6526 RepID=A0A9W3AB14_BIOGL|nr:uncharacterized protein LOC129926172 [Biomphalaria glabrata]